MASKNQVISDKKSVRQAQDKKVKTVKTVEKTAKVAKPAASSVTKVKDDKKTKVNLTVRVIDIAGKSAGTLTLPEEIFGEKVNKTLLAQAVRVYLANKRQGNASTKTRGEVDGSTRKIYRQKGTGRARHGSLRAPIFVKGGIVFGPKPRDFSLDLPKKMKRKALFSALSAKLRDGEVIVISGLEKLEPKTKAFVGTLTNIGVGETKRKALVVAGGELENVKRASNNVTGVTYTAANRLNAYDVLAAKHLIVMKEAIDAMKKTFLGEEK